ncbi:MAG TPA: hypothetical protein PK604_13220 [Acetivibrio clariflavus]|nr:hypothetical protein [Acetivibrio clariflavus]HPU41570.1 hypothetical protein [Acetivibrio clariflavus]
MIILAEFCTCGSLMLDGTCTNKNCKNKTVSKSNSSTAKKTKTKDESLESKPKTTRIRRASKCITYNLYDLKEENSQ